MMEELDRIKKVMQNEQLNSAQFALEIGIQGSTLSHILNGRNNPSLDVLKKILHRYPHISSDWLIMGIGSISRAETKSQMPNLFDSVATNDSKSVDSGLFSSQNINPSVPPIQPTELTKPVEIQTPSAVEQLIHEQIPSSTIPTHELTQLHSKSVRKIIVYYSDNTFQEFVG